MKNSDPKVLQYAGHNSADSSDKDGPDSIDILSASHYEPASHWTENNPLLHGYPLLNSMGEKPWPSMNIGIAIRDKEPVVLNGERFWLVE